MDAKLILQQAICLLFRESQLEKRQFTSKDLVKEVVGTVRVPEQMMDGDRYRETLVALRTTALYLADLPETAELSSEMLLHRIRVNVGYDTNLYDVFVDALRELSSQEEIKKHVLRYRDDLRSFLRSLHIKEVVKKYHTKISFGQQEVDWSRVVDELIEEIEPLRNGSLGVAPEWLVDDIDLSDLAALEDAIERSLDENNADGMMSCGWQGVNRMLGEETYYRRGDFVVVGALQHNFKTGWMTNHIKHFALYNTPYMRDPSKKPLLVYLSTENSVKDNLISLYISLKENETNEPCDVRNVSPKEVARYVMEKLSVNGYHIKFQRVNPTEFTFRDLFDMVLKWESEGYEIHALLFDYLNMISKKGCAQGPMGSDIRDLFRRVRNFMNPRGILFMTPHQLASDAKQLLRAGVTPENFVKEIANKGYWDSCRVIDQEVDLEIYIHIVKTAKGSFLTIQRGKHRKPTITPEKYLFCVLPFSPVGGIRDDILGEDTTLKKVGGKPIAEGGDSEWFDGFNQAA